MNISRIDDVSTQTKTLHLRSTKVHRKFTSCHVYNDLGTPLYYELKADDGFIAHIVRLADEPDYYAFRSSKPRMIIFEDNSNAVDERLIEEGFLLDA